MKRYEVKPGLLSCWECGSDKVYLGSRMCPSKPDESLTHYMFFVECKECGCSTGCMRKPGTAIEGWNAAYSTPEELSQLKEFEYAVSLG